MANTSATKLNKLVRLSHQALFDEATAKKVAVPEVCRVLGIADEISQKENATLNNLYSAVEASDRNTISTFILHHIYEHLSAGDKEMVFNNLTNPMTAFQHYLKKDKFSKKDEALLIGKFKGKLPTAEEELKSGKLNRK